MGFAGREEGSRSSVNDSPPRLKVLLLPPRKELPSLVLASPESSWQAADSPSSAVSWPHRSPLLQSGICSPICWTRKVVRRGAGCAGPTGRDSTHQMCRQGRRGREGEILGAFLSLPVGGREHDKNSGRQDCGGHKKPAQSFLAKINYLHSVQAGMNICWYPTLCWGTWGTTRASLTFLGLDLKNLLAH